MNDEHPAPEDLDRFDHETGYCPECGTEVWDDAPSCPKCHAWIEGGVLHRPPGVRARRRGVLAIVAIVVVIALTWYLWAILW